MKKLVLLVLMLTFVALICRPARAGVLDLDPLFEWIQENGRDMKAGGAINFRGKLGTAFSFPVYTFHNGAEERADQIDYAEFGIGYSRFEGDKDRAIASLGFNLITLSHKAWKSAFGKHVRVAPFPDFWIGPYIQAPPLDDIKEKWVIGDRTAIQFVYKFIGPGDKKGDAD